MIETKKLESALKAAIEKAGENPAAVELVSTTLDRTWGDQDGYVLVSASPELAERAAQWVLAYCRKHVGKTGYGRQNAVGYCPPREYSVGYWHYEPAKNTQRRVKGPAVSTYYTPCAE